jgi:N-acetylglucosaminyldiphosphoundecaprenol N-acetyl-beta-D-mannosaminyltransferase
MPLRERVAGSDLVPRLFAAAAEHSWNIHCLGSSSDVATRVELLVADQHPTAAITVDPGPRIGPAGEAPDDLIDAIRSREPDILLVALGHPKQEHFIATHGDRLGVPVMVGIGATLDMMVGKRSRAPQWMRSIGLEWAYRAVQEPRRLLPRYAHDLRVAVPAFYHQWVGSRRPGDGRWGVIASDQGVCLSWNRSPPDHVDAEWYGEAVAAIRDGAPLTIDIASGIPGAADIAELVGLWRVCRLYGRPIVWEPAPDVRLVERLTALALPLMGLE